MVHIANAQKTYAWIIGLVLLLVGIIGFFSNNLIFGLFGVNASQNILHIIGGLLGIWLATKGSSKSFNLWLGYIAAIIAILGFIPATSTILASIFGINLAITWLHVVIAVVSLGVAYGVKE